MKKLLLLFVLFNFQSAFAQELTLRKGIVIDTLSINDSISETYSLYLPTSFDLQKTWPIIFVFDANGMGSRAVQLFRHAAETQGYIIAASNNISEEETLLNNLNVGARLMNRVFNFFPINKNLVFTSGFGEGGRVASLMPTVFPIIKGVMPIGDAWVNPDYIDRDAKFYFLGLAGYSDHKFNAVRETTNFLKKAKFQSEFYPFDGGREWPSAEVISNATGSLTLASLSKGHRVPDAAMVENLYQAELGTVENLRLRMQFYKAYELLKIMETKYALFDKSGQVKDKMKELRKERLYKNQNREYTNAAAKEADYLERYYYFFSEDVISANFENLGWWSQQIKELQDLQEGSNVAETEMAYRLEGQLGDLAKQTFRDLKEANSAIDPMVFTSILQTIFNKEEPEGYMNIISLSAQDGDYYTSLLYLEDLLKTGYKDMESLYEIPGTLDLKMSPEYNSLVKQYLGNSKYYNN